MSYLIQLKDSFIKPLKRKYPALVAKLGEAKIRGILLRKIENRLIPSARFFMDDFRVVFSDDKHDAEAMKVIEGFLSDKAKDIKTSLQEWKEMIKNGTGLEKGQSKETKAHRVRVWVNYP